jgi:hypothetical protein
MRTKELDKLGREQLDKLGREQLDKLGREVDEAFKRINKLEHDCARDTPALNGGAICDTKTADYLRKRDTLIKYLREKTTESDWHGVSDAANDLRVLEAEHAK